MKEHIKRRVAMFLSALMLFTNFYFHPNFVSADSDPGNLISPMSAGISTSSTSTMSLFFATEMVEDTVMTGENFLYKVFYNQNGLTGVMSNGKIEVTLPKEFNYDYSPGSDFRSELDQVITREKTKGQIDDFQVIDGDQNNDGKLILTLKDNLATGTQYSLEWFGRFLTEETPAGTAAETTVTFTCDVVDRADPNIYIEQGNISTATFTVYAKTQTNWTVQKDYEKETGAGQKPKYTPGMYHDGQADRKVYIVNYDINARRNETLGTPGAIGIQRVAFVDQLPQDTKGNYPIHAEVYTGTSAKTLLTTTTYNAGTGQLSWSATETDFGFGGSQQGTSVLELKTPYTVRAYFDYDGFKYVDKKMHYNNVINATFTDKSGAVQDRFAQTGFDVDSKNNESNEITLKKTTSTAGASVYEFSEATDSNGIKTGTDLDFTIKMESTGTTPYIQYYLRDNQITFTNDDGPVDGIDYAITAITLPPVANDVFDKAKLILIDSDNNRQEFDWSKAQGNTVSLNVSDKITGYEIHIDELAKNKTLSVDMTVNVRPNSSFDATQVKKFTVTNKAEGFHSAMDNAPGVSGTASVTFAESTVNVLFAKTNNGGNNIDINSFIDNKKTTVKYDLKVTNKGNVPLKDVVVDDLGLKFYADQNKTIELNSPTYEILKVGGTTDHIAADKQSFSVTIPTVPANGSANLQVEVEINNPQSEYIYLFTNFAELTYTDITKSPGSNQVTLQSAVDKIVTSTLSLQLTKTATPKYVDLYNDMNAGIFQYGGPDTTVSYKLHLENTSSIMLTDITIKENGLQFASSNSSFNAANFKDKYAFIELTADHDFHWAFAGSEGNYTAYGPIVNLGGLPQTSDDNLVITLKDVSPGQVVDIQLTARLDKINLADLGLGLSGMYEEVRNTVSALGEIKTSVAGTEQTLKSTNSVNQQEIVYVKDSVEDAYVSKTHDRGTGEIDLNNLDEINYTINAGLKTNGRLDRVEITDNGPTFVYKNNQNQLYDFSNLTEISQDFAWIDRIGLPKAMIESYAANPDVVNGQLANANIYLEYKAVRTNSGSSVVDNDWQLWTNGGTPVNIREMMQNQGSSIIIDVSGALASGSTGTAGNLTGYVAPLSGTSLSGVSKLAAVQIVIEPVPANLYDPQATPVFGSQYRWDGIQVHVTTQNLHRIPNIGNLALKNTASLQWYVHGTEPIIVDDDVITIHEPAAGIKSFTKSVDKNELTITQVKDPATKLEYTITPVNGPATLNKMVVLEQGLTGHAGGNTDINYNFTSISISNTGNLIPTLHVLDKTTSLADPDNLTGGFSGTENNGVYTFNPGPIKAFAVVFTNSQLEVAPGAAPVITVTAEVGDPDVNERIVRIQNIASLYWKAPGGSFQKLTNDAKANTSIKTAYDITIKKEVRNTSPVSLANLLAGNTEPLDYNIIVTNGSEVAVDYKLTDAITSDVVFYNGTADTKATTSDMVFSYLAIPVEAIPAGENETKPNAPARLGMTINGNTDLSLKDHFGPVETIDGKDYRVYTGTITSLQVIFYDMPGAQNGAPTEYQIILGSNVLPRSYTQKSTVDRIDNTVNGIIDYYVFDATNGSKIAQTAIKDLATHLLDTGGIPIAQLSKTAYSGSTELTKIQSSKLQTGPFDFTYTITAGHADSSDSPLEDYLLTDTLVTFSDKNNILASTKPTGSQQQLDPDLFRMTALEFPAYTSVTGFEGFTVKAILYDRVTNAVTESGQYDWKPEGLKLGNINGTTANFGNPIIGFEVTGKNNSDIPATIANLDITVHARIAEEALTDTQVETFDHFTNTVTQDYTFRSQKYKETADYSVEFTGQTAPDFTMNKTNVTPYFDKSNFAVDETQKRLVQYTISGIKNQAGVPVDQVIITDDVIGFLGAQSEFIPPDTGELFLKELTLTLDPSFKTTGMDTFYDVNIVAGDWSGSWQPAVDKVKTLVIPGTRENFKVILNDMPEDMAFTIDVVMEVAQKDVREAIDFSAIRNGAKIEWTYGARTGGSPYSYADIPIQESPLTLYVSKEVYDKKGLYTPNDNIQWDIYLTNMTKDSAGTSISYIDPYLIDILPKELVTNGATYYEYSYGKAQLTGNTVSGFTPGATEGAIAFNRHWVEDAYLEDGTKSDALIWQFTGELEYLDTIKLTVYSRVKSDVDVTNMAYNYIYATSDVQPLQYEIGSSVLKENMVGKPNLPEIPSTQYLYYDRDAVSISRSSNVIPKAEALGSLDVNGGVEYWSSEPAYARTEPNSWVHFRYSLRNNNQEGIGKINMVSVFPYIGDKGIITGQSRFSEWEPTFVQFINPNAIDHYTYDSNGDIASTNSLTRGTDYTLYVTNLYDRGSVSADDLKGTPSAGGIWQEFDAKTFSNSEIGGFLVVMRDDFVLKENESLQFTASLNSPLDTETDLLAWNSLAVGYYSANAAGQVTENSSYHMNEPNKIGVQLTRDVAEETIEIQKTVYKVDGTIELSNSDTFDFTLSGPTNWHKNLVNNDGIPFGIIDNKTIAFSLTVTNGEGVTSFANIPRGSYYLTEVNNTGLFNPTITPARLEISDSNNGSAFVIKADNSRIKSGSLLIKKLIQGEPENTTDQFVFELTHPDGNVQTITLTGHDSSVLLEDLAVGEYSIVELAGQDFQFNIVNIDGVTVNVNQDGGTFYMNPDDQYGISVIFTNERKKSESLTIEKVVANEGDNDEEFHFTLSGPAGLVMDDIVIKGNNQVVLEDLPIGQYMLVETGDNAKYYTLTLTSPDGSITISPSGQFLLTENLVATITATNTRNTGGNLTIEKILLDMYGHTMSNWAYDALFTVRITGESSKYTETVTFSNDYRVHTFNGLPYDTYHITEENLNTNRFNQPVINPSTVIFNSETAGENIHVTVTNRFSLDPPITPPTTNPPPTVTNPPPTTTEPPEVVTPPDETTPPAITFPPDRIFVPYDPIPGAYLELDEDGIPLGVFMPEIDDDGNTEWIELDEELPLGAPKMNPKTGGDITMMVNMLLIMIFLTCLALEIRYQYQRRLVHR